MINTVRTATISTESQPRYWLSERGEPWRAVTQGAFISAEQNAGFRPKQGCGPVATGGFSSSKGNLRGAVTYGDTLPTPIEDER